MYNKFRKGLLETMNALCLVPYHAAAACVAHV